MKNADMPAMPVITEKRVANTSMSTCEQSGLTKREMFAMHAMPSVIKWLDYGVERGERGDWNFEDAASHAVIAADALLEELEK